MSEESIHKAKLTTSRGTFEFEGSKEFVEAQIGRIVELETTSPAPAAGPVPEKIPASNDANTNDKGNKKSPTSEPTRKRSIEQPKMLPKLISTKEQIDSLKKFYGEKKPANHVESFAVLTHWLGKNLQLTDVSIDEMWTLYKVLQIKPPKVMIQTLRDGKSKKAYFEPGKTAGRYYLTPVGETFVEFDLPPKTKQA